jgi:hypothetical protein
MIVFKIRLVLKNHGRKKAWVAKVLLQAIAKVLLEV